jgi:hypothetical protein
MRRPLLSKQGFSQHDLRPEACLRKGHALRQQCALPEANQARPFF